MEHIQNLHDDEESCFLDRLPENALILAYRTARKKSFDDADAKDAAQTAFEELLKQPEKLKRHPHPHPDRLLYSIAKYRGRDIAGRRRRQLDQEVPLSKWDPPIGSRDADCGMGSQAMPAALTAPHPVERVIELEEARERVAKIAVVVRGLSPKRRRIFGLCIVRKRPRKEVARKLGLTEHTVRNEVWRIRRLLNEGVFGGQDA